MSESKTSKKAPAPIQKKPLGAAAPTSPPADPKPAPKVESKPVVAAKPAVEASKPAATVTAPAKPVSPPKAPAAKPASKPKAPVADKPAAKGKPPTTTSNLPDQSVIDKMVAEAAYYLAEKRSFAAGFEEEDWLKAKEQIMSQLLAAKKPKKSGK